MKSDDFVLISLFEASRDIVWTATLDGRLLTANVAIERVFGYSLAELRATPRRWLEAIHPDDRQRVQRQTGLLGEQGQIDLEYRIIRADGQVRWLLEQRNILYDAARQPIGLGGIAKDITTRKETELALQLSEGRYRAIVEAQPEFVVVCWQPDGECSFVNQAGNRTFQQTPESLIGHNFINFIHPDDRQAALDKIAELTPQNPLVTAIQRVLSPAGRISWFEWSHQAVFDRDDKLLEIQSVGKDITPRQHAQTALTRQKEILQTIIDNIPVMIAFFDNQGQIALVNNEWERLLGWTFDEVSEHTNILAEIHPDSGSRKLIRELINAVKPGWHELKTGTKQGQVLDTQWAYIRLSDGASIGIGQDISELKKVEAQLYQAQKVESIGRLAGGIAHDLNNLLGPIIGYAELGQMDLAPEHKLYGYLAQIIAAGERAAALTRQILAFGRRQMLELRVVDLNNVVTDFEPMLRRLIGEDIEVHTFLEPQPYLVKADKSQLEQVLMNLAINARDAMPTGGKLTLETGLVFLDEAYVDKHQGAEAPGYYVMLAVSDTGHGMTPEIQQQIFEPFFTTKTHNRGTGLGLSTVFGIVKQHHGNIWVYSERGNGTTFKIYLPQDESAIEYRQIAPAKPASLFGTETILVVEDNEILLELVSETLEAHRYRVLTANTANEAAQTASAYQEAIDLVLTDVILPDLNGRDVYRKMVEIHPTIKVLYMSGYTDNVIVHHGILEEGIDFLQKPFNIQTLTRKVREVLG